MCNDLFFSSSMEKPSHRQYYPHFGGLRTIWVRSSVTFSRSSGSRKVTCSSSTHSISRSFHEDHSHSFRPPSPYQPLSSRRLNNEWRLNILLFENRFQPGIGDKIRSIGFRTVPWPKKRIVWIFLDNALFRKQFLRCHFSEA